MCVLYLFVIYYHYLRTPTVGQVVNIIFYYRPNRLYHNVQNIIHNEISHI